MFGVKSDGVAAAVYIRRMVDRRHSWEESLVHSSWLPNVCCSHSGGGLSQVPRPARDLDGLVHLGNHLRL